MRKLYPGVCVGIFYDEASSEKLTDDNGDLNAMGQLYFDYNEAARLAVRCLYTVSYTHLTLPTICSV